MKLRLCTTTDGEPYGHWHYCPGCEGLHLIPTTWAKSGSDERPTFAPSVLHNRHDARTCCHYFIRDGRIEFCGDSHHAFAGRTVDLPDIPEAFGGRESSEVRP